MVHVEGAARVRVTDLEAYVQGLEPDAGTQLITDLRELYVRSQWMWGPPLTS